MTDCNATAPGRCPIGGFDRRVLKPVEACLGRRSLIRAFGLAGAAGLAPKVARAAAVKNKRCAQPDKGVRADRQTFYGLH
jgi:hypothetical protein